MRLRARPSAFIAGSVWIPSRSFGGRSEGFPVKWTLLVATVKFPFVATENRTPWWLAGAALRSTMLTTSTTRERGTDAWMGDEDVAEVLPGRGVSTAELSRRFGVSRRTIHEWVDTTGRGQTAPASSATSDPRDRRRGSAASGAGGVEDARALQRGIDAAVHLPVGPVARRDRLVDGGHLRRRRLLGHRHGLRVAQSDWVPDADLFVVAARRFAGTPATV